jgi:hypothetical protein
VLIDRTHMKWIIASLLILGVAALFYVIDAARELQGPRGGTPMGLIFGAAGFALVVLAGLLGLRKRFSNWQLGRAQTWMRAHLWLSPLSFPLILFHGGFHFGGTLTTVLMVLLTAVVASGIIGAVLQHLLPRRMTREVPLETVYEQIDAIRSRILEEADQIITSVCGAFEISGDDSDASHGATLSLRAGGATAEQQAAEGPVQVLAVKPEEGAVLQNFYLGELRPFLKNPSLRHPTFGDREKAAGAFESLRRRLPRAARPAINELEDICEEERQLARQVALQGWLQGWLLVHVPLSIALVLLGAAHAVIALRF